MSIAQDKGISHVQPCFIAFLVVISVVFSTSSDVSVGAIANEQLLLINYMQQYI